MLAQAQILHFVEKNGECVCVEHGKWKQVELTAESAATLCLVATGEWRHKSKDIVFDKSKSGKKASKVNNEKLKFFRIKFEI